MLFFNTSVHVSWIFKQQAVNGHNDISQLFIVIKINTVLCVFGV